MVKKSLLFFLVLFVGYTLVVIQFPEMGVAQNQNQINSLKAETYLYEAGEYHKVAVVGTSLSARLVMDSLPGFTNLAFSGMSPSEGLSMIIRRPELPEVAFLESNFYWYNESAEFQYTLLNPVNFYLKEFIPSFRSDKQPLAIATQKLMLFLKKQRTAQNEAAGEEEPVFQKDVFENTRRDYAILPDSGLAERRARQLKQQIEYLESKGMKIVFFEMPIRDELINTIKYQYLRNKFREFFPESRYSYLPEKSWGFKTTDGIHLTGSESLVFTLYLREYYREKIATLERNTELLSQPQ